MLNRRHMGIMPKPDLEILLPSHNFLLYFLTMRNALMGSCADSDYITILEVAEYLKLTDSSKVNSNRMELARLIERPS